MITEATIILPAETPLNAVEMDRLRHDLVSHFGGYTVQSARGAWLSPNTGKIYEEPVNVYTIASDWDNQRNVLKLSDIASDAADRLGEECVYVRFPNRGVLFVTPRECVIE